MTLRTRLALVLAGAVVVGAIIFMLAARATVEQLLYADVDRDLRGEISRTIDNLGGDSRMGDQRDGGMHDDQHRFNGRGPGEFFGRGALYAQVATRSGEVILRTSAVEAVGGLPGPKLDVDDDELVIRTARIDGERFRLAEANGPDDTVVQVARPLSELTSFVRTLQWVLLVAGAIALAAAALLGRWVARATLRPVEQMTRTAREIAGSPRRIASARVTPAFPDPELADFADAMNEMLESIDAADRHQRQFVADASHELRTPLTSLGGNASWLQHSAKLDADAREAVDAVTRDVDRLARIADGLTMLARLDARPTPQLEPVDVDAVVDEAIRHCASAYPTHEFTRMGAAGVQLLDAELMRRIVGNLLDNAGRYTPAGCVVAVTLATDGDTCELVVTDDGPGIDASEHAQVLDRFRRGSTSTGIAGTGLGLAIVAEAASELGGSLALTDATPHGLQCRVVLRSAPPAAG